jgi:hypothetical protein
MAPHRDPMRPPSHPRQPLCGYLYRKCWVGLWSPDVTKSGGIPLEVWSDKTTVGPPHREHGTVSSGSWPPNMNRSSITRHLLHLYWHRFIHFLPAESMEAGSLNIGGA